MENPSRAEAFPVGLRVLVVDDDPTWLKILEKMLRKCSYEEVGPKKILDLMNVPGLTRENVASHLQKYRLYLRRLQKQNEGKSYGGNTQSDFSPKGPQANFGLQNPTPVNQNNATSRCVPITQNFQAQNRTPEVYVDDVKSTVALHVKDQKEAVRPDIPNTWKVNSAPPLGIVLSFKGMMSNVDCKPVEPSISKHQPCSAGIPVMQFMQYPKHDHEPYSLLEDYSHQPLTSQLRQTATSQLQTHIISISCDPEDKTGLTQIKPVFTNFKSRNNKAISPVACTIDSISVLEHGIVNSQDFGAKHETNGSANLIPPPRELSMKNGTDLISIPEDLPLCSLQNIGCFENVGLNGMEIFQCNDSTSLTDFHSNWYDGLEFNCEYLYDPVEYPIIDDCLFA